MYTEYKIKRKRRAGGTVATVTESEDKRYGISFKRRRMHDHSSVPFGYIGVMSWGEDRVTARPSMCDDLRWKHPFSCLVVGPDGSGKSSFCIRFLQNLKALCTEPNFSGGIIWYYSESATPSRQLAGKKHVRFHGVPAEFNNGRENPCLIFPDDLLNDAYSKDYVTYLRKAAIIVISVLF